MNANIVRARDAEPGDIGIYTYNRRQSGEHFRAVYQVGDLHESYHFRVVEGDVARPLHRELRKDVGNRPGTSVTRHDDVGPIPASIVEALAAEGYKLPDDVEVATHGGDGA